VSVSNFGSQCGVLRNVLSTASSLSIPADSMASNATYEFTLLVSTRDGRSASKTVTVTPLISQSIQVSITSVYVRFNPLTTLIIDGHLLAPYAVTAAWTVLTPLGVPVPYTASTAKQRSFTASIAASQVTYPLSVKGGSFTAGNTYTFRLSAFPKSSSDLGTSSEIQLTANSPPSGGYITSDPSSGYALQTYFLISNPGWSTDAENYPLMYSFSYKISESSSYLTLSSWSLRAFTRSTLPEGLSALSNQIIIQGRAADIYNSTASATTNVAVTQGASTNITRILTTSLGSAFSVGNYDSVYQAVNNVRTCC
jgi:REJ domain